nr:MBL fold metallo-hydrolase [Haloechinothrix aidingensis]
MVRHAGQAMQFDTGRATVLRLAEAGVGCDEIDAVFVTHHHADHLVALPDLLITRWVMGAREPLPVVAPSGPLDRFGAYVLDLWADDIAVRSAHTGRPPAPEPAWTAFEAGGAPVLVWEGEDCRVTSIAVRHEPVRPAVAYRVDTSAGSVVISGDTRVCEEVERLASGVDVLVHEAVRVGGLSPGREYIAEYHADTVELGAMAERAGVARLILTHLEPAPADAVEAEAFGDDVRRGGFTGDVLVGADLLTVGLGVRAAAQSSVPSGGHGVDSNR